MALALPALLAVAFLLIPLIGILSATQWGELGDHLTTLGTVEALRPLRVFPTVTMPMAAPGLIAGAALTWARALGEFGATITFGGNLPGTTQSLPLQVLL